MHKKNMEDFDKKEIERQKIENEKKIQRMNIINEQMQESKLKMIQDFQEKLVEGQIMKLDMKKALEQEKLEQKLREQKAAEQRRQYIEENRRLLKEKEIQKQKELNEEKKIEEYAKKKRGFR